MKLTETTGQKFTKILVYGVCGSGKTTLAEQISKATGLPWHSVDELTWEPDWKTVPDELQRARIEKIIAGPEWILDTAYGKWIDIPLAQVELIVALDYSRSFTLWRLLKRTIARAIDKKLVCNGNVESWRQVFSRDSILIWHFKSFKRKRQRIQFFVQSPNLNVIVLKNQRETTAWLSTLAN